MDTVEIFGLDKQENSGVEVIVDGRTLSVDEYPLYYTHLVASMGYHKNPDGTGSGRVFLSGRDYNEERNLETIKLRFDGMCKVVRSIKRKGGKIDVDTVKSKSHMRVSDDIDNVLAAEAIMCGGNSKKVDIQGMIRDKDLYTLSVRYYKEEYEAYLKSIGF